MNAATTATAEKNVRGEVHCPICTHTVGADIDIRAKRPRVVPGQNCPRCASKLDAAYILEILKAA
jgi:hypothetical protein